jgi:hypothetical protein
MTFEETIGVDGFNYRVQDVFGEMKLESVEKLDGDKLDDIFMAIMTASNGAGSAETIKGSIESIGLNYTFKKANLWLDEEGTKVKIKGKKGLSLKDRIKRFIINLIKKL